MWQTIRYMTLAGLLGSCLWIGTDCKSPEPYVTAFVTGAVFLGLDVRFLISRSRRDADRTLFEEFLKAIPSKGIISYIKTHDVRASFDNQDLEQIHAFCSDWNDPEHEFLDSKLENLKLDLYKNANNYWSSETTLMFTEREGRFSRIPRDWEWKMPDEFKKAVAEMGDLAKKLVDSHELFVRTARRKLGVKHPEEHA